MALDKNTIPLCLVSLGLEAEDWGPDTSSYAALSAGWRGSVACPSQAALEGELAAVEAALALAAVREMRRVSYPALGDQLDALMKQLNQDRLAGKALIQEADDWLNACLAVKAAHPLPGGG